MYVSTISHSVSFNISQGSGTVTILEAYRALLESEFQPENDIEFHWYSAEVKTTRGSSR
jgi:hypothetical protein